MKAVLTRRAVLTRGLAAAAALTLRESAHTAGDDAVPRSRHALHPSGSLQDAPLHRRIPSSGDEIPSIGLGSWQTFDVGPGEAERAPLRDVLRRFVALGGRVIDSAPMYNRSEGVIGDLTRELELRSRIFLATKVWTRGRTEGVRQMQTSLERLRAEQIELMQVHNLVDMDAHLETLAGWKADGRVRYVGVTHYTASAHAQLERAITMHDVDFVQLNYSLAEPEADRRLLPLAAERGVAVLVNRPFAEGSLFSHARGRELPAEAGSFGARSWAQVFLKWILGHPAVTCVIPATSNPRHLEDNMGALIGGLPSEAMRRRILDWI